jgi:nicotinate-nucleotide pyrophosphorylase (carboxylating)
MGIDTMALPDDLAITVLRALQEDIGSGDITAQLIDGDAVASASIISREHAVLCGTPWANEVLRQVDRSVSIDWLVNEGDELVPNQTIVKLRGPARALLTAERCMLNFLQTLSATASVSRAYARKVAHTDVKLLDTRKTIPGLRTAQKYAVRVGGCFNHRMGLFDAFLIKENHISACGSIAKAIQTARQLAPAKPVEVEVETFSELDQALSAGADIIMLDNFSLDDMRTAVRIARTYPNSMCQLEASGGINDQTLVAVAETGVDFISMGVLTKDVKAIDLSMRFEHFNV